ncbi:MAG: DUF2892 domain-containing protein [Alphaproteobacteria bacterium]|nr:DUF2892 domain-containing protein [Alphaproteobacteria bacterium]
MKPNIGKLDKIIRIIAGIILIGLAIGGYFTPWSWIGVVPLLTALVGWCPAYRLFGLNSCPVSANKLRKGD